MIRISKTQFDAFKDIKKLDMHSLVLDHIQREFPHYVRVIDPKTLGEMISVCVKRAHHWGFKKPESFFLLSSLMFDFSPTIDRYPKMAQALCQSDIPPDERLQNGLDSLTEEDLAEIEKTRNHEDWFPELDPPE